MNAINIKTVKRGDIYLYDLGECEGSLERGKRPVLVVQSHRGSSNSPTTIIAAISSSPKKLLLPSHVWLGKDYGLKTESVALLEQLRTVEKSSLGTYVGSVNDEHTLARIDSGLKRQFGLLSYQRGKNDNVRCLCPRCLADYRAKDSYVVRRVDPYNQIREACMKCGKPGNNYFIYEKYGAGKQHIRRKDDERR